jgi:hypothetical protein
MTCPREPVMFWKLQPATRREDNDDALIKARKTEAVEGGITQEEKMHSKRARN